jgi:hypothetical protein
MTHVYINEREVGALDAAGATVGEMVEALGVHVELDGVRYSAGEEKCWARRAAIGVRRLVLGTSTPAGFALAMRHELAGALEIIAAKVEGVVALFARGNDRDANALLAALLEELRLALVLEQQVTTLDGVVLTEAAAPVGALAPDLLAAQERRAWHELAALLAERLAPALRTWSGAERAHAGGDAGISSTF